MRLFSSFFSMLCLVVFIVGCSGEKSPERAAIRTLDQLNRSDFTFGGEIGTVSLKAGEKKFQKAKFIHYQVVGDAYPALESGKIDAIIYDKAPLDYAAMNRDIFKVLPGEVAVGHIAVGAPFRNRELVGRVNEFIRKYRADGTYRDMYNRWINSKNPEMPEIPEAKNPSGTIVIGSDCTNEPMTFMKNGTVVGFDIEFSKRLAYYLNMKYESKILTYDALFPAAAAGKVDLAVANMDVTEERKKNMLFTDEYLDCPTAVLILKKRYDGTALSSGGTSSAAGRTLLSVLVESFRRTFINEDRWKLILRGLSVTVIITVLSAIFGTCMAFGVCALRRSAKWYFRIPAKWYISLMQGTPMLVLLMILYYIVFASVDIDAVAVAVIGFAMNFAAYAGEMMRTGIDTVDKGQIEAAKALGFGRFAVFRRIVFPQAARRIIPVYRGEFINMLKMTSIVGYIAIQDLTKMSDIIRSRTYEAFFPLIATAVIYFLAAHALALALTALEMRLDPILRRKLSGEYSICGDAGTTSRIS